MVNNPKRRPCVYSDDHPHPTTKDSRKCCKIYVLQIVKSSIKDKILLFEYKANKAFILFLHLNIFLSISNLIETF